MSFKQTVERWGGLAGNRIQILEDAQAFQFSQIQRGIVLPFAEWSGVAPLMLKRYSRLLRELRPSDVSIYALNQDSLDADSMLRIFGKALHGHAETYFVHRGRIEKEIAEPGRISDEDFVRLFHEVFE